MSTAIDATLVTDKERRRQKQRLNMCAIAIVNALIHSGMIGLFAAAGTITATVALAFFAVSLISTVGIYGFTWMGWNKFLPENGLIILQLATHGIIELAFIFVAPNLTLLFLLALFVVFSYGVIQLSSRQFTIGWLLYGLIVGIALWAVKDRFGYPGNSGAEIALIWLYFFLALRQHTLVSAQFSHLRNQVSEKNRLLQSSLVQLEELASKDFLTGALNRRCLIEKLEEEMLRSSRTDRVFCFAMIDLDHFKKINDTFGHPIGDVVLKKLALCAKQCLRETDSFGRLGGEEFGILLTDTPPEQGAVAMERLRVVVAAFPWSEIAPELNVTFSAGVTSSVPGDTTDGITKRVDEALYRAKRTGRNMVVFSHSGDVASLPG